jgi:hypothetical protein
MRITNNRNNLSSLLSSLKPGDYPKEQEAPKQAEATPAPKKEKIKEPDGQIHGNRIARARSLSGFSQGSTGYEKCDGGHSHGNFDDMLRRLNKKDA